MGQMYADLVRPACGKAALYVAHARLECFQQLDMGQGWLAGRARDDGHAFAITLVAADRAMESALRGQ